MGEPAANARCGKEVGRGSGGGGWAVSSCFVAQAATFVVIVIKIMLECFVSLAAIAALPRAAPVCVCECVYIVV